MSNALSVVCVLALVLGVASAASFWDGKTGPVQLLFVKSIANCPYGMCGQNTAFTVAVQNKAYEKNVVIHYKNPITAQWEDLTLSYLASPVSDVDLFSGSISLSRYDLQEGQSLPLPIEFAVKYTTQGQVFWNKNETDGNNNYKIQGDFGAILTGEERIYNGDYKLSDTWHVGTTQQDYYINMYTKSKVQINNVDVFYKNVTVRYTEDNWATYKDTQCTFYAYMYAGQYSGAQNPNNAGYETWSCTLPVKTKVNGEVSTLKYSAKVQYLPVGCTNAQCGQTAWDNNFGSNYATVITWKTYA